MILQIDQIRQITQGACQIYLTPERRIRFSRFTQEEETLPVKDPCPAGIQLEFRTDATCLNWSVFASRAISRSMFAMDVFANGNFVGAIQNFRDEDCVGDYTVEEYPFGTFTGSFPLGAGEKHVRVVLPYSVNAEFGDLEVVGATYVTPVRKKHRILMHGDSITHGYDAKHPSATYAMRLGEALDAEVYNKAISGLAFYPELAAAENGVWPDLVTVAFGTNDWNSLTRQQFEENCRQYAQVITQKFPAIPVYVVTPLWRKDHTEERLFGEFQDAAQLIQDIFNGYPNITVVPGWDLIPHEPTLFGDLRLHPNDDGFRYYAQNLEPFLKK